MKHLASLPGRSRQILSVVLLLDHDAMWNHRRYNVNYLLQQHYFRHSALRSARWCRHRLLLLLLMLVVVKGEFNEQSRSVFSYSTFCGRRANIRRSNGLAARGVQTRQQPTTSASAAAAASCHYIKQHRTLPPYLLTDSLDRPHASTVCVCHRRNCCRRVKLEQD